MNYRILILFLDSDGNPVVLGAVAVDPQTRGLWTCRGARIRAPKGAANGWTTEDYATVVHITGNIYVVFAKPQILARIDPDNKGKAVKDVAWPWKVIEYLYNAEGEITGQVETNTPTIRGIGGSGMTELIRKEPLKAEAIPL